MILLYSVRPFLMALAPNTEHPLKAPSKRKR